MCHGRPWPSSATSQADSSSGRAHVLLGIALEFIFTRLRAKIEKVSQMLGAQTLRNLVLVQFHATNWVNAHDFLSCPPLGCSGRARRTLGNAAAGTSRSIGGTDKRNM